MDSDYTKKCLKPGIVRKFKSKPQGDIIFHLIIAIPIFNDNTLPMGDREKEKFYALLGGM